MARSAGAWRAKLRPDAQPRVVPDVRQGGRMLVATPLLVAEEVCAIPRGRVVAVSELRARLAQRFNADHTCPLSTGIFLAILAGVVADELRRGRAPSWPIWRVVGDDGRLPVKWPLEARYRAVRLREEGHRIGVTAGTWAVCRRR